MYIYIYIYIYIYVPCMFPGLVYLSSSIIAPVPLLFQEGAVGGSKLFVELLLLYLF